MLELIAQTAGVGGSNGKHVFAQLRLQGGRRIGKQELALVHEGNAMCNAQPLVEIHAVRSEDRNTFLRDEPSVGKNAPEIARRETGSTPVVGSSSKMTFGR